MAGSIITQANSALRTDSLFWDVYCDASTALGDVVHLKNTSAQFVESEADNKHSNLSIGFVVKKLNDTKVRVQMFGPCTLNFTYLTDAYKVIFLGEDGEPTTSKPSGGYLHTLGHCYYPERIFINPAIIRIKQNPF